MVDLGSFLKGKTLILGVGNPMKQDDGAGPCFVWKCQMSNVKYQVKVELLDAGTVPENYTGKIKQIKPDTLVIVDAIDFRGKPGEVKLFTESEVAIPSFSTHQISLKMLVSFLKEALPGLNVIIIGIQPKQVGFGEGLSKEVEEAVDKLCTNFI